nr:hypothetical protein CFP56_09178 [Quercus suber]
MYSMGPIEASNSCRCGHAIRSALYDSYDPFYTIFVLFLMTFAPPWSNPRTRDVPMQRSDEYLLILSHRRLLDSTLVLASSSNCKSAGVSIVSTSRESGSHWQDSGPFDCHELWSRIAISIMLVNQQ